MVDRPGDKDVVVYAQRGDIEIEVRLEQETVWLTQLQIAKLFGVTRENVNLHLSSIYRDGELDRAATCKESLQVRTEGKREVRRKALLYNLDVILSVGYRVNSKLGTQFRIWATRILKARLLQDYERRRREEENAQISQLTDAVSLANQALVVRQLVTDEGRAVLDLIERYAKSFRLLLQYDENRLPDHAGRVTTKMKPLTLKQARSAIAKLKAILLKKGEASDLFGVEPREGLAAILGSIEQTFDKAPLYPSVESRAAQLLYLVIKDHPFTDGNKRIGGFLFVHYLDKNDRLRRADRTARFDDRTLAALALLIAESPPAQHETMIRLTLNLIDD